MDGFVRSHLSKGFNIYNIPIIANTAHQQAMTIANIVSGFRSTGIYPFNRDIFADSDFSAAAVPERINPLEITPSVADYNEPGPSTPGTGPNSTDYVSPKEILPCP